MKIALIDDHLLFAQSVKNLLVKNGYLFVSVYNSIHSFTNNSYVNMPDLIILDLSLPDMNGIEFLEKFRKNTMSKVIVLSVNADVQNIKKSLKNGADGFLSKNTDIEELVEAIETVVKGNRYIEKSLREALLENMFTSERISAQLSLRERDVLNGICRGSTIKEIAYEIDLSPQTVQYHYRNLMNKLNLKRNVDLIAFALQHGLYSPKIK